MAPALWEGRKEAAHERNMEKTVTVKSPVKSRITGISSR
jgi:hypothetical protein